MDSPTLKILSSYCLYPVEVSAEKTGIDVSRNTLAFLSMHQAWKELIFLAIQRSSMRPWLWIPLLPVKKIHLLHLVLQFDKDQDVSMEEIRKDNAEIREKLEKLWALEFLDFLQFL